MVLQVTQNKEMHSNKLNCGSFNSIFLSLKQLQLVKKNN